MLLRFWQPSRLPVEEDEVVLVHGKVNVQYQNIAVPGSQVIWMKSGIPVGDWEARERIVFTA